MQLKACLLFCLCLLTYHSQGQLRLLPLGNSTAPVSTAPASMAVQKATGATASGMQRRAAEGLFPFWDDFSYYGQLPDTLLWQNDSSSTITYGLAHHPPSWGVVTLDGIDARGNPYNTTSSTGNTDQLTSKPIDLTVVMEEEQQSVYLSFFWQLQGLGERPDARDSLKLYFLDEEARWRLVWSQTGSSTTEAELFQQELISLTAAGADWNTSFFHEGFQLRFQSYSRQNGQYDQWHLDYIFLDKGRSANDLYYKDRAFSEAFPSLLQPYTAMPMQQFFANPAAYLRNQLPVTGFSFFDPAEGARDVVRYQLNIQSELGEPIQQNDSTTFEEGNQPLTGQQYITEEEEGLAAGSLAPFSGRDSLYLVAILGMRSSEDRPELARNNRLEIVSVLHDYFAYDDGSAEAAITLNGRGQRLAYRFTLEEADTLTAVSCYFPYYNTSTTGQVLNLKIWTALAGINGAEADVLRYTQRLEVQNTGMNRFVLDSLRNPQILGAGEFFIGFEQMGAAEVPIGFDRNTDNSVQVFQSINTEEWLTTFSEAGSPMIRAHFQNGVDPLTLGLAEDTYFPAVRLYPNPARDRLVVTSEAQSLRLYDPSGRLVLEQPATAETLLELGHLQPGLYLLQLSYKTGIQTKRVIIVR